ncbi:DUF1223 domain-containing protein [Algihabitans albus]|uniref:DUF1223 domain-containing protein n=1 Tax=Algihabitans albus TaxID=2164067 RepID=UPI000E5D94EA|nr:DUF1223 domain-containing protein [Algihabitans albus]
MLTLHKTAVLAAVPGLLLLLTAGSSATAETRAPVVVELYTSQGCSSCPPADALLAQLADRDDVIALSLHVDYWDYIGWEDPFALASLTKRQRAYARSLDRRTVYTPQIVVDGTYDVIGSRSRSVANAIAMARERPSDVAVDLSEDAVRLGEGAAPPEGATVWLLLYDRWHETDVRRGENAGRLLGYAHVVRDYRRLGTWSGRSTELSLDLAAARAAGRFGVAVVVQTEGLGRVLGAAALRLE